MHTEGGVDPGVELWFGRDDTPVEVVSRLRTSTPFPVDVRHLGYLPRYYETGL